MPKLIGLAPSKRIPLFNGDLECRRYEFVIVSWGDTRTQTVNADLIQQYPA